MCIPNLQVLSFPFYSFLSHWWIFWPKDSPSLCPLDLIPFHLFRNLILLILSCLISSASVSFLTLFLLFYICSDHSPFLKNNHIKTYHYLALLSTSGFNLPPLYNQNSYFHCLTSHLVFFSLQSGIFAYHATRSAFTKVPNDIFMSLNLNAIFITNLIALWKAACKADYVFLETFLFVSWDYTLSWFFPKATLQFFLPAYFSPLFIL